MVKSLKIFLVFIFIIYFVSPVFSEILKDVIPGRIFIVDDLGYIYTNFRNSQIKKYSPSGRYIMNIGQYGEGPGDIKRLGVFNINPINKHIYVAECFGNKWISIFSSNGNYKGEWKGDIDWKKYQEFPEIAFDVLDNTYILASKFSYIRETKYIVSSEEKSILKFTPKGKFDVELFKFKLNSFAQSAGKGNIRIPFSNDFRWLIINDRIIIYEFYDNYISIYGDQGLFQKKIKIPFKREIVAQKDIDNWYQMVGADPQVKKGIDQGIFNLKFWRDNLKFPKFKPLLGRYVVDKEEGFLYINKNNTYNENSIEKIWVKIDLKSGKISIMSSDSQKSLLYIWKEFAFVATRDNDGETIVQKIKKSNYFIKRIK